MLDRELYLGEEGDVVSPVATIYPANASYQTLSWTSSDPSVCNVNATTGKIVCLSIGEATITVASTDGSGAMKKSKVRVGPYTQATSISLDKTNVSLTEGESLLLTATIMPLNATSKSVAWITSDSKVATVENGVVKAVRAGSAIITASTLDGSNLSQICVVMVEHTPVYATSIEVDNTEISLGVGATTKLAAIITPLNVDNTAVVWSSSNNSVASVNKEGVVTAVSAGEANITATTTDGSNLSSSCKVTVKETNYLVVSNVEACKGGTIVLPVNMSNTESIKGVQFDLTLPNGVTVATDAYDELAVSLTSRAHSSHSVSARQLSNGYYRIVVTSMGAKTFNDTEGNIMNITLNVAGNVEMGEYDIKVSSIALNTADNVTISPADVTATLTVTNAKPGDVNGDGSINVTDVGMVIDDILENTPANFSKAAADVNGDKVVNVTDAGLIIDIILSDGAFAKERGVMEDMLDPQ